MKKIFQLKNTFMNTQLFSIKRLLSMILISFTTLLSAQEFTYTVTDANMTVQVGADVCFSVMEIGDLLGAFFTNSSDALQNAGYTEFIGDQLAIAVWASESGLGNGFIAGEEITWMVYDSSEATNIALDAEMNSSSPFSDVFTANAFGQVTVLSVSTGGDDCVDDDAVVSAFGGCTAAVAALGCDFVFAGVPIGESCSVSCDSCPSDCVDDDTAVSAFGGCAAAIAALGCDFVFAGVPIGESCPVSCDSCPSEEPVLACECSYGNAIENAGICYIFNGCSDILSSNYCPGPVGTIYQNETCTYDEGMEGCMCSESDNYNATAVIDNGTCFVLIGGCSDPLSFNYSGTDCDNATFNSEDCEYTGCMCPESYNYDSIATIDDASCVILMGGCSDPLSNNYSGDSCTNTIFSAEDCQYEPEEESGCTDSTSFNYNESAIIDDGSCYSLEFDYTITDANMTIQVGVAAIQLNGELGTVPNGSLLGAFYTNNNEQLQCAGYEEWTGDQLAIAVFASESGLDNGFATGEEITWILSIYGQNFIPTSVTMNPLPPFSVTYAGNGFGQLLLAVFEGEVVGVFGCMNELASNYNSSATIDDGSCVLLGCTDFSACNYNDTSTDDDGSCYFESVWYYDEDGDGLGDYQEYVQTTCDQPVNWVDNFNDPCPGDAANDSDGNGICDANEILGCTNVNSSNYDFFANVDDSSCIIPGCTDENAINYSSEANEDNGSCISIIFGCMNELASNYNPSANTDDGSCCYISACIDENAFNYNPNACFDDGSCIEAVLGCTNPSSFNYDGSANTDNDSCVDYIYGCDDIAACNYDDSVNISNGSCSYATQYYDCDNNCLIDTDGDLVCDELEILGCTDSTAFNFNPNATDNNDSCEATIEGCLDNSALNYNLLANTDDSSCCFIEGCLDGSSFNYNPNACFDDDSCIETIVGCTDSEAFNYNSSANIDNGSCVDYIYGCIDFSACNYDELVNTDNSSCAYADEFYDCEGFCLNDLNNNGTCDELEVSGCTNPIALNYNPNATEDSGICIIAGCTDTSACNYNSEVNFDDSSCTYANTGYDCNGVCVEDSDGDGVCDQFEVLGCIDASACNFDLTATDNDGSCYNNDLGCGCDTPSAVSGYDCNGVCLEDLDGDSICDEFEVLGCLDSSACNYDSIATDDDGCDYAELGYDCLGNLLSLDGPWGNNSTGCDPFNNHIVAFTSSNFNIGDFIGLFYTSENGEVTFAQAIEYTGDTFYFTVCGDDSSIPEKDGFEVGESFIWQVWPEGEECAYNIDAEYSELQPSAGEYQVNGVSQVVSNSGSSLSATVTVTDVLCNGDLGSAELIIIGGVAPYIIEDLSNLSVGSYSTTVIDSNGCESILDFTIEEPELLEATVTVTDALCNGDNGSIELVINGGVSPYEYVSPSGWIESTDLNIYDNTFSAGSYSTTVTDSNGCEVILNFTVSEPGLLETTVSITDALCSGDLGSVELTINGGTEPYDITYFASGLQLLANEEYLNNLPAGLYNLTIIDFNNCETYVDFNVEEPELLEATVTVTDALCNGDNGSIELVINGGVSPYEYISPSGWIESTDLNIYDNTFGAGSHSTIVTDSNGCEVELEFTITEPALLEATVTVTDVSCNGSADGSVELTIIGGASPYSTTYFASGLQLLANEEYLNSFPAGLYNLTIIDSNNCETYVEFTVEEPELLEVILTTNDVSCNGESNGSASVEIIGGNGGYDYSIQAQTEFNIDSQLVVIDNLDNLSAGYYVITVIDEAGCYDITEFSISEPEELSLSLEVTNAGEYLNCESGSITSFVEGGIPPYSYEWSNGEITSDISALCGGEYSLIVTDSNGCIIEGTINVDYLAPEGWDFIETDDLHIINIPSDAIMLLDQIELTEGDYLGVFYNQDGLQYCGGYIMWLGQTTQLVTYGSGFSDGEQFNWRVWDNETQIEAHGFAAYDDSYEDERYFANNGESGLLGAVFATHQVIPLNENTNSDWDIISTYINNSNDIDATLAPVINELIIIKDANGNVYWPSVPVFNLNEINTYDAYAIKTYAPNDLTIYGDFIQPEEILFELSGWNYISYPRYYPEEVDVVFEEMLSNIELLKDDNGSLYWPELNINTIGQMEAGEGYIMKVGQDQFFTYPSNSDNVNDINGSTIAGRYGLIESSYYTDIKRTSSNMVIGLPDAAWVDFDIQYGDEIAVYDSQGMVVGVAMLDISNNAIIVWEDDMSSLEKDGMIDGELLHFELWQSSTNHLYNLEIEWKEGGDLYSSNGINIASLISVNKLVVDNFKYISCFPNPNTGEFTLEFELLNQENINIFLYNALGEKVYEIKNDMFDQGLNSMSISLPELTRGLYYLELSSSIDYKNIIIDLIK